MTSLRIEDVFADVSGGRTFVRRWLPALPVTGVPIVLLHDSLGSVEQWRDFPAGLAERLQCEVIAYDRPGFGRSTPRHDAPSLDFIADEARSHFPVLRAALGLGDFGLLGHSVGGAMAVVIAATHADSCRFLVTESA
ncbi:alpha/beta fold hydrolase [Lysobacter solisilvae (ex Woo and Kim 2020)]|uniref:alpha/beta fold hydrolase n=1 Tax=Agrilutibacter terrestris TaxID=2865112 RepID=UPI001ABA5C2C|nr:alpha/beta fold hydrolase [Lysobacter terrestris]